MLEKMDHVGKEKFSCFQRVEKLIVFVYGVVKFMLRSALDGNGLYVVFLNTVFKLRIVRLSTQVVCMKAAPGELDEI